MRVRVLLPVFLVVTATGWSTPPQDLIPDPGLREAIAFNIGKASSELTADDLANPLFTFLWAQGYQIENLEGIQFCMHLKEVLLPQNRIRNLAPLGHLGGLVVLDISANPYWYRGEEPSPTPALDLSLLQHLPALKELWVGRTNTVGATSIVGIENLKLVWLEGWQDIGLLDDLRERDVCVIIGSGDSKPVIANDYQFFDHWLMGAPEEARDDSLFLWSVVAEATSTLLTGWGVEWYESTEVCIWSDRTMEEAGLTITQLRDLFTEVWTSDRPFNSYGAGYYARMEGERRYGKNHTPYSIGILNPATGKLLAQRIRLMCGEDIVRCVQVDFEWAGSMDICWY